MNNPVELVVAAFQEEERAGEVLGEIQELERLRFIGVWNAAVITEHADGELKLKGLPVPTAARGGRSARPPPPRC